MNEYLEEITVDPLDVCMISWGFQELVPILRSK
jgi:hypothetical protein